jgi:hypothetical protein
MMALLRRSLIALLIIVGSLALARPAVAATPPFGPCSAGLTIFTTSPGTVTTTGSVEQITGSGVGGQYTSGFLAGDTLSGTQDVTLNTATQQAQLIGMYTVTGPDGTLAVRYVGFANLATGQATGYFFTAGGTGTFAAFQWTGGIRAQLVSTTPPTFKAMDSGICGGAP